MTTKTIAVVAALLLTAINCADARTSNRLPNEGITFDRATGNYSVGELSAPRAGSAKRKAHRTPRQVVKSAPITKGDHVVTAKTGAKASVSIVAKPHFVCLIEKLESAGYQIDFMGGYASRGNSSAHPTGNALDINQTGRNVVTRRLPSHSNEIAQACGLVHGKTWANPDQGHFEMPKKYGYLYRTHRTRLARVH